MKTQYENALKLISNNPQGFTSDFSFKKARHKKGYYVAVTNNANNNPYYVVTSMFKEKAQHNDIKLFGGWRDLETGLFFLDLSKHESDLNTALNIAREHQQKAIWDIKNQCSVMVDNERV